VIGLKLEFDGISQLLMKIIVTDMKEITLKYNDKEISG
jgi:hypothetical protein